MLVCMYICTYNYRMMSMRSSRSTGMPWGESTSVPRMVQTPLLVANITMGESDDSKARFRKVKHSMSNICTYRQTDRHNRWIQIILLLVEKLIHIIPIEIMNVSELNIVVGNVCMLM